MTWHLGRRAVRSIAAGVLLASAAAPSFGRQFRHPTLGYTFTYASPWICDTKAVRENGSDGPVLRTFPSGEWIHGGIIPPGGAVIFVQASPRHGSAEERRSNFPAHTDAYARLYEMAKKECPTCDISRVRHSDGTVRVDFTETWEAGAFKEVWMSQTREGRLVVLMLHYYADDRRAASYEHDLEGMVSSIFIARAKARGTSVITGR